MFVKSTLDDTKNITTRDEVVIQKFRSQGVSIPLGICHVIYVSKNVEFLDALTEITNSTILVENEKVVAVDMINVQGGLALFYCFLHVLNLLALGFARLKNLCVHKCI